MPRYLSYWYSNLKPTIDIKYLDLHIPICSLYDSIDSDDESIIDEIDECLDQKKNASMSSSQVENKLPEIELKMNRLTDLQRFNVFLITTSSFLTASCFLFSFLLRYMNSNNPQLGLAFLLVNFVMIVCEIYHFPSHRVTMTGFIHLRVLKWAFTTVSAAMFLLLLRNHVNECSTLVVCFSLGVKLFKELPHSFPATFTFNELLITSSTASLSFYLFLSSVLRNTHSNYEEVTIVTHALVWLVLVLTALKRIKFFQTVPGFFLCCLFPLAFYFVPMVLLIMDQNPFVWLFNYLFIYEPQRVKLLLYWIGLFSSTSLVVFLQRDSQALNQADKDRKLTQTRKLFHLLIVTVYSLGLMQDKRFLYLCSFGLLILFSLLEAIRYFKIGVLYQFIEENLLIFVDEKDRDSTLITSHIFLLVGLSYPIWFSDFNRFQLSDLSGLITVGIGDSFASIIGSKYGRHKYPESKKSIEGTLGLVVSQLVFYLLLSYYRVLDLSESSNVFFIIMSLLASGFVEAFSVDNDNLVLPIVVYPFLYLIK